LFISELLIKFSLLGFQYILHLIVTGASHFSGGIASYGNFLTSGVCFQSLKLKVMMSSVLKLQRWWRGILFLKLRTKSAIVIQAHIRGWIGRQMASRERQCVALQVRLWLLLSSAFIFYRKWLAHLPEYLIECKVKPFACPWIFGWLHIGVIKTKFPLHGCLNYAYRKQTSSAWSYLTRHGVLPT
jgi:hypothetical protein